MKEGEQALRSDPLHLPCPSHLCNVLSSTDISPISSSLPFTCNSTQCPSRPPDLPPTFSCSSPPPFSPPSSSQGRLFNTPCTAPYLVPMSIYCSFPHSPSVTLSVDFIFYLQLFPRSPDTSPLLSQVALFTLSSVASFRSPRHLLPSLQSPLSPCRPPFFPACNIPAVLFHPQHATLLAIAFLSFSSLRSPSPPCSSSQSVTALLVSPSLPISQLLNRAERLCHTILCVSRRLASQCLIYGRDDLEGSRGSSPAPPPFPLAHSPTHIDRTQVTRSHYMPAPVITSLYP